MTGIDLFNSHVRCFTMQYNMADLRRGEKYEVLGEIYRLICYYNDKHQENHRHLILPDSICHVKTMWHCFGCFDKVRSRFKDGV